MCSVGTKLPLWQKTAQGDWRGLILFGFFTGLRLSDVANLTWDSIDLEKRLLRLRTKKTGCLRHDPSSLRSACVVGAAVTRNRQGTVIPVLSSHELRWQIWPVCQFKRILERAQIGGRIVRAATGQGRKQSSLSFHSLRHSFVSALANAGIAPDLRQSSRGIRIRNHMPATRIMK